MQRKLVLLTALLLAGLSFSLPAQVYIMNGTPITDCNGTIFDSGGGNGNYGNNQNLVTTICSDGSAGTHIRVEFSGIDVAAGDVLCFHDGPNIAAPVISCSSDYPPGQPIVVQATAVNPSGCLTLEFTSDATGTATGWSGIISCQPSCQQIIADIVSTNPVAVPADTGWIDVCPGERIFFNGQGQYPQNGFAYQQSDLTTTFEWSFGDGGIAYGPAVSHTFTEPGGYFVQLLLTDVQGCQSTNLINQRIRVAPRPNFSIGNQYDQTICAGDTIHLDAAVNNYNSQNLFVSPNTGSFSTGGSRSDSLALPDGNGIPYETSIYFTEFSPGQVLTSINDLESICVNMEHSWMRDLQIALTCPNGQNIVLHNFGGQTGSQVFLGVPNDNDGFSPVPGTGWDYCWTPNATNSTWINYANTFLNSGGTLPTGNYSPFDPFSDLLGCPLNGEWTITVTDLWAIDNGYIFSWGINFNPALYPSLETFTPQFLNWNWSDHPSIFYETPDSIAAAPQNAGTAGYIFTVNDDFGCTWDTLINISVLPHTHPSCYSCSEHYTALYDTAVCLGRPVQLDASVTGSTTEEVRFEAFPDYPIGAGNHPHNNPYQSPIAVNSLGFSNISNAAAQITSVCIDIETDFDADLNIVLRSPDGKQLDLSTGNGGAGDNYKVTCFAPGAATPIVGSPAPFNGTFSPEGSWNVLNGAQVNGNWKLVVSDGFGVNQYGRVKWWSIGFNVSNNISYSWTNSSTLSCNNCPNPVATPTNTTAYCLTAIDSYNCIHHDTATVGVLNFYPTPTGLHVSNMIAGNMTWSWDLIPGLPDYEVSVNNGAWVPLSGTNSYTVSGLQNGNMVQFAVRPLGGDPNCPIFETTASATYSICNLDVQIDTIIPVHCFGQSNGSATAIATGNMGPLQFFADGAGPGNSSGVFNNIFNAGVHFIVALDSSGCRDTVFFTVTQPAAFSVSATGHQTICNAGSTGSVTVVPSGGTGPYTYLWQTCAGAPVAPGDTVTGLIAGCYGVTATDANGCTASDTAHVAQPLPLSFTGTQDSVSCAGGNDGSATIFVTGGISPFNYIWDNGSTQQTAMNLNAVFHSVTVIDAIGCQKVTIVQVLQPPPLQTDSIVTVSSSCSGSPTGSATVYAHGGTKPYQYLWSNGMTTKTAAGIPAGTYTVIITDAHGCSTSSTGVVNAPLGLSATLTATNATCFGGSDGTVTAQVSGGTPGYIYNWNVPQTGSQISGLSAGTYSVTVSDLNGCTLTGLSATVGQPAQAIQISQNTLQMPCENGSNGSITVGATGGNGSPFTFNWNNGQNGPNASNLPAGNYVVTAVDNLGCTATQSFQLAELAPVQVSVAFNLPSCFGSTDGEAGVNQINGGAGGNLPENYQYHWSVPGSPDTIFITGLTGGQTYTVTATDNLGCSGTYTFTMGQPPAISFGIVKTDISCFGLTDGIAGVGPLGGGQVITNYQWSTGSSSNSINGLAPGMYTVTITDGNGCMGSNTFTIAEPDLLVADLVEIPLSCNGTDDGSILCNVQGGTPAFQYAWSNGAPANASIGQLAAGSYTVTVTDANGCTTTSTATLADPVPPVVTAKITNVKCAGGNDGRIEVNVTGGTPAYRYSINGGDYKASSVFFALSAGMYKIQVQDVNGCIGFDSFEITEPPLLSVALEADTTILFGESVEMQPNVTNGFEPLAYTWSTSLVDSLYCIDPPECSNMYITPDYTNTVSVRVTDANGCRATASRKITVEKPRGIFVPTGFTPNADVNNDRLVVYGKSKMVQSVLAFRLYDRWGELVYEDLNFSINDETRGWDGRFRGKDCDPGVYVWVLEVLYIDGFSEILHGNTTLIR